MPSKKPEVTGLLLAGGEGRRVGGRDKGLLPWQGQPVAAQVLARLRPQVDALLVSANRNASAYAALAPGATILADDAPGLGPLGGWLTALRACPTPWLACVPCDAPQLPLDLVARLRAAGRDAALAATPDGRAQPMFVLLHTRLAPALHAYLHSGQRTARHFLASVDASTVAFDDPDAFANLNLGSDYG